MQERLQFYIDGKWVAPAKARAHDVINPSNEEPCGRISLGSAADVDARYAHLWTVSGGRGIRVDAFYDRDEALAALKP